MGITAVQKLKKKERKNKRTASSWIEDNGSILGVSLLSAQTDSFSFYSGETFIGITNSKYTGSSAPDRYKTHKIFKI